ncbi:hypothetical protein CANTEDRAFT_113113 [Yamadazyma tenuis ATCC 10573]|nr:uncharacterized protein CANTEDRAFT_113113 [Yamadazyma tenuis ATCC 10573]EGV65395.1 hypothetical protein CANTEDRAFT_113113 [Yamadazyma tenuis ATCC 10573]
MQGIRLRNLGLQHMAKSFQGESAEIRVDLWVSFLIITLYYLADECNDNWSNQLRSCQQLLRQSEVRAVTDPVERKLFTYTVEFFSYQESMGRTACHKSNVFNEEWTKHLGQAEGEVVLIPWMGCDKRLIRIVSDITDLSISALPQQTFREKRAAIMDELENIKMKHFNPDNFLYMIDNSLLDQSPASCDDNYGCLFYYYDQISDEAANMEEFCFLLTCEIKRLCGLLYATSCLYYQSPSQPSIVSLVTKIFNYTKFIIISNNFFWSSLTWPLYMISTQLDFADPMSEVQKLDILNMFDMIDQKGLGNVGKAKSAVETLWKKRSLYDRAKGKEKKTYWEFVVDPVCNISLV